MNSNTATTPQPAIFSLFHVHPLSGVTYTALSKCNFHLYPLDSCATTPSAIPPVRAFLLIPVFRCYA